MIDDATLLRRYAQDRSENDFAELVRRHLNLVYSAALRQVNGDAHLAQDATQLVFTDLARKAGQLASHQVLAGWLFTSTRFAAAKLVRGERRRQHREKEAQLMQEISSADPSDSLDWDRVRPVLDEALGELNEGEREAILLRYLEGRDFSEVGERLSLTANAARMRVDRAVDKLRSWLTRRGITSTAGALAIALANQAVIAAPAGLAATVTGTALAASTGGVATLAFMSITKLQIGIASAVLAVGAGSYVVQERHNAGLRAELASLQTPQSETDLAALRKSNRALERAAVNAADLRVSDAELVRLREEAVAVQARQKAVAAHVSVNAGQAVSSRGEYNVDQLDLKPKPKVLLQPAYPYDMHQAGVSGNVTVSFVVDANGNVSQAQVVKSSRREFEEPALKAVKRWQFEPGKKGGRMVNTRATQLIEFNLDQPPGPTGPLEFGNDSKAPANWF